MRAGRSSGRSKAPVVVSCSSNEYTLRSIVASALLLSRRSMSATPSIASSSGSRLSRQKKTATHQLSHSIRAQAASSSSVGADRGKGRDAGLVGNSKIVYKALLESPLNVKWYVPRATSHC